MHMQKTNWIKKYWWIIAIGAILIIAGIVVLIILNTAQRDKNHPNQQNTPGTFSQSYSDTCEERDVAFTSPPMKMQDLGFIRPLGAMLDGHVTPTDHVYVGPVNSQVPDNTYPVIMPADGTVVEVSRMPDQYVGDRAGQQLASEDHRIVISFSCRYFAIFIHIHKLADTLRSQIGSLSPNESKRTTLALKAGETVGFIGGSTFDWTPVDTSSTLTGFITPDLYKGEPWKIHTVSPFELYTGELRSQLEAKSLRTAAPIGGKIDYDQKGKLIGNWFRSGSGGYSGNTKAGAAPDRYWDGHLAIVPDYIDPAYTIVSLGNWQDKAQQFLATTQLDPAAISEQSGMTKIELSMFSYVSDGSPQWRADSFAKNIHPKAMGKGVGTLAVQVLPGEKLKIEKFIDKTPAQVTAFTGAAETFER